jgi:hypothetical protein
MGDSGGNSEDQSADRKVDNQDCGENWFSIGDLCYILMKSLSTFCWCPETSNKAKLKSNGLGVRCGGTYQ